MCSKFWVYGSCWSSAFQVEISVPPPQTGPHPCLGRHRHQQVQDSFQRQKTISCVVCSFNCFQAHWILNTLTAEGIYRIWLNPGFDKIWKFNLLMRYKTIFKKFIGSGNDCSWFCKVSSVCFLYINWHTLMLISQNYTDSALRGLIREVGLGTRLLAAYTVMAIGYA